MAFERGLEGNQHIEEFVDRGGQSCGSLKASLIRNHVDRFFVDADTSQAEMLALQRLMKDAKAVRYRLRHRRSLSHSRNDVFVLARERLAVFRFEWTVAERREF